MTKRAQNPSQQIISFRFRFVALPVVWDVLTGEKWERFKAVTMKKLTKKLGEQLSEREIADFDRRFVPAPLLYGRTPKLRDEDGTEPLEIENLWVLRDEFFELPEGNLDKLAVFLNRVGAWPSSGDPSPNAQGHVLSAPYCVAPNDIWDFRRDLRSALLDRKWFETSFAPVKKPPATRMDLYAHHRANDFHLRFEISKIVAGIVTITNARHALFATVLADIARGVRFKVCARKGCDIPFPVTSKHKRKFHSPECGHLAVIQRGRQKARAKAVNGRRGRQKALR